MSREDKMQLDEGGAGRVAGRVFAFVGVTPVSYTHLRAHET